jgi:hypothetical protein
MDGEILRKIDPSELHNGAWMKKEVGLDIKTLQLFVQI